MASFSRAVFSLCFAGCLGKSRALLSPSVGVPRVQRAPAMLCFKASSPKTQDLNTLESIKGLALTNFSKVWKGRS